MAESCIRAVVPPAKVGKALAVFALENRRALHIANGSIKNCQQFYEAVREAYGEQ